MIKRFKILSQALGFRNKTRLAEALGVSPSYLSQLAQRGTLNDKFRENLALRFPRANPDFLETGIGEPLLPEPPETEESRREKLIGSITEVLAALDEPARQVIFESIRRYQKNAPAAQPAPPAKKNGGP